MSATNQLLSRHGLGRAALTGTALGLLYGVHATLWLSGAAPAWLQPWCLYVMAMCGFHLLEFLWSARFEPATVSCNAFLLNHSPQYHAAVIACVAEYWLEALLLPGLKGWGAVSLLGLALVSGGQCLRTTAMWTAGSHFTHLVAEAKRQGHDLVTHGVYAHLRHPSYTGWFWWSVGTQLLLGNPVCSLAYAAASWRFFAGRIPHEEALLVDFFGDEYVAYAKRTRILIPLMPSSALGNNNGRGSGGGARMPSMAAVMGQAQASFESHESGSAGFASGNVFAHHPPIR